MGNASRTSSKIWRTVVVAGAMLGTPLIGGCNPKKPVPAKPAEPPKDPVAKPGDGSGDARPRAPEDERPIGRGFILA